MKNTINFMIIGGDCRFSYMQKILEKNGFGVKRIYPGDYKADDFSNTDVFILPVPVSRDNVNINAPLAGEAFEIKDFLRLLPEGSTVAGGLISESLAKDIENRNACVFDYYKDHELVMKNAVPTAEGVIGILINSLPVTIDGLNCCVTGYGKCGRALCLRLKALGASVTVAARSDKDILNAEDDGMNVCYLKDLKDNCSDFDAVVNTVPARIIGEDVLSALKKDCVLIEIASAPFGIDFDTASKYCITAIKAGSIPGRTSPVTAGKIICDTVISHISEGKT